eukprot:COSAG01_NODE_73813_length_235_cov_21.514706_1_plen_22_part_10
MTATLAHDGVGKKELRSLEILT